MNNRPPAPQMRNNPWGFQAQNWNVPITRGPPPQHFNNQAGPNFQQNCFYPPNGQQPQGQRFPNQNFPHQNAQARFNGPPPKNFMPMNNPVQVQVVGMNNTNMPFCHPNGDPMRPQTPQTNVWNPRGHGPRGQGPRGNRPPGKFQQGQRFPYQNNDNKQKKNKKRRDPAVNGESCEFYCDTCDRGYKDKDKYDLHISQHEKCPKEGCSYIAAGKLVQLHIKLQHNSGLAKKIWSLESKKDIEKWREDRRQNFPTAANIERKKALLAEKIGRGEVIEEKYFGKMQKRNDRGRDRRQNRFNRNENKTNVQDRMKDLKRKLDEEKTDGECSKEKQTKVDGDTEETHSDSLGVFFNDDASDTSSSEDGDGKSSSTKLKKSGDQAVLTDLEVKAGGALGSLITSYMESDVNSDEEPADNDKEAEKCDEKSEVHLKKIESEPRRQNNRQRHRNKQRNRKNNNNNTPAVKCDKSLLEKLLAKEIRQERNKILQCVHYIVKNNFFDK